MQMKPNYKPLKLNLWDEKTFVEAALNGENSTQLVVVEYDFKLKGHRPFFQKKYY